MRFKSIPSASFGCAALAAAMLLTSVASADDSSPGFELGLRLGYAFPFGEASEDSPMDDGIWGHVPLWLDLGYRVTPQLFVGAYGQWGPGSFSGDMETVCDDLEEQAEAAGGSASCSIAINRLGAQFHYRFSPEKDASGWLGAGIGYEWMPITIEAEAAGTSVETNLTASGLEFINLQFGWDFDLAPSFRLGPWLAFSVAEYDGIEVDCSADLDCSAFNEGDIENSAIHKWLFLGVRGALAP